MFALPASQSFQSHTSPPPAAVGDSAIESCSRLLFSKHGQFLSISLWLYSCFICFVGSIGFFFWGSFLYLILHICVWFSVIRCFLTILICWTHRLSSRRRSTSSSVLCSRPTLSSWYISFIRCHEFVDFYWCLLHIHSLIVIQLSVLSDFFFLFGLCRMLSAKVASTCKFLHFLFICSIFVVHLIILWWWGVSSTGPTGGIV